MKKKTKEEFEKEVFDLVGSEYEVLGEYVNAKTKIKIKHVECGFEYEVRPDAFLANGARCPKCARKKTTEGFKEEVFDLVGSEYEILGVYKNNKTKIKIKHNKCGYEYEVTPNNFSSLGNRCSKCSRNARKTTEIFKKEVFDLVGDEYEILEEYVNTKTKIKMKHVKCGFEYEVRPNNFLDGGRRCPRCADYGPSKGEKELVEFVKSIYDGLVIENDRTIIPSMMTDLMYELDVFLPEINLAIEYNGKYWHDRYELKTPGYHAHKKRICDEKGIKLINVSDSDWTHEKEKIKELIVKSVTTSTFTD